LHRVSTVDALVDALRRRVLNGELGPGARLRETELAATYGVGRYTVRAAFQELVYRGMAEHRPNRGVSVLEPSIGVIRDLYSYRAALECEAARLIVEREIPLDGVRAALKQLEALPADTTWERLLEADLSEHRAIVGAAGNRRMDDAFASIVDQIMLCLSTLDMRVSTVTAEQRAIVRALAGGDAERAVRKVREHLYEVVDQLSGDGSSRKRRRKRAKGRPARA
jgi:DNA-binding GntR family transcriptional regulator